MSAHVIVHLTPQQLVMLKRAALYILELPAGEFSAIDLDVLARAQDRLRQATLARTIS